MFIWRILRVLIEDLWQIEEADVAVQMQEGVERRAEQAQKQAEDVKKWAEKQAEDVKKWAEKQAEDAKKWAEKQVKEAKKQAEDAKKQAEDVEKVNQILALRIQELEAGIKGQSSCSDIPGTTWT